ncbi:MAG TPA: FtsH protease activity modulator HflK [Burkholderiales bacterium]|jgi:modulator of FtsH protease HflK|nr:FtsH protease activity modulator HflK [Burkholderiales bacterium]
MSLNDPQWGRKGGGNGGEGGPPDLDEMWRNLNQRLGGLFGRKGGGEGGNQQPPGLRQAGGFIILAFLILAVWLASGIYTVDESEQALVLTFGKHTDTTGSGLRWRLPYPIQTHELVNVEQSRNLKVGSRSQNKAARERESLMLTRDENIVDIEFAVVYSLSDAEHYQFNIAQQQETVLQVAETVMREIVGKSSMDYVLNEGREQIAVQSQKLMQEILNRYNAGVAISSVQLLNAQAPEQVQEAFNDAVKARQDLDRLKNEGQAYYNDVVPKAAGMASRLMEEANGYRQRVVSNAEGEAARFRQILDEYSKAPVVTRDRLYMDAMQQVLTNSTKIMVDARSGNNMLFLPLDKLLQASTGALPETPAMSSKQAPAESSASAATADALNRSRDSLRNRERDAR